MLALLTLVSVVAAACAKKPEAPPAATEPEFRVAMVYDVGGRGDQSFNDMAYAGLEQAKATFGDRIEVKDAQPSGGGEDREQLLRTFAEQGYGLVFGVGFLFTDSIQKVAAEFPNTKFAIIDGFLPDLTETSNATSLLFKEHEGSFLVGAAAALKTQSKKVGFVGGMEIPLIKKFEAGYLAGVYYVDPTIETFSDYAGTTGAAFNDPVKGRELALAQIAKGADVIYHASGGTGAGVFEAVTEKNKWAIGVDADQSLTVKDEAQRARILTSMRKKVDVAVFDTIKSYVEGNFKGGYRSFGLAEGGVDYAVNQYNEAYLADIKDRLEEIKQKIISGEIVVPDDLDKLNAFKSGK